MVQFILPQVWKKQINFKTIKKAAKTPIEYQEKRAEAMNNDSRIELDLDGYTPLMLAIVTESPSIDVVAPLLEYKADVSILTT